MTWIKLDDQFPDHPKFLTLTDAAIAAWVRGLCYASRYLTDGALPRPALTRGIGTARAALELERAGLWHQTDDGWTIHDYQVHQRTAAETEGQHAAMKTGGTFGNHKRWHTGKRIVDPDCEHCQPTSTPPSPPRSGTRSPTRSEPDRVPVAPADRGANRGAIAEVEVEVEVDSFTSPPVSLTGPVDNPEDRVKAAINRWADNELAAARNHTTIRDPQGFRAAKIAEVDRSKLAGWARDYPNATASDLAAALANPQHLRYLTRRTDNPETGNGAA